MAEIVLVHGIGNTEEESDFIEEWLTALCAGSPPSFENRLRDAADVVNYRDWSWATVKGAQGPDDWEEGDLTPEQLADVEELAFAWLEAAAASSDIDAAIAAGTASVEARGDEPEGSMGSGKLARQAVAGLSKVPVFGSAAFDVVQRINRTNLWQVTAYVNDYDNAKAEIWERFGDVANEDTRIVLAHSLGTVVAYEAIHRLGLELDLLLTTGSPLGLDSVIYPKLVPKASFPPGVRRWVNVADRQDFIAADPTLADRFRDQAGDGQIIDIEVANDGPLVKHHRITEYLKHDRVRRIVWEAFGE